MDFSEIFSKSWREYKKNFKLILKAYWWFYILPLIILGIIGLIFLLSFLAPLQSYLKSYSSSFPQGLNLTSTLSSLNPFKLTGNAVNDFGALGLWGYAAGFIVLLIIFGVIFSILYIFLTLALYHAAFYNEKGNMKFREAASGGKRYFWRFLGLSILISLIMILLSLPGIVALITVIIGAILKSIALVLIFALISIVLFILAFIYTLYLGISWLFSTYILMKENKKILESMRTSKEMVKGKWWRIFGYFLLIMLIIIAISVGFSIASSIITLPLSIFSLATGIKGIFVGSILNQIIGFVFSTAAAIITTPLGILFFKNLYLDMKKSSGKN